MKILFAMLLLFGMSQLAGVAVELTLHDTLAQLEQMPMVHPQVTRLMKYHGVQYFDYNEVRQEYGFWRHGRWCPAR